MNRITPQDIQKGVETVSASPESTWYKVVETLDNGDKLCLAIGMGEGFDEDTICAKLGILVGNSAMTDYAWDFQMPWNLGEGDNDTWDTEVSDPGESDAEWFNKTAQEMIKALESGEIGTSLLGSACGKKKGKKKPVKSAKRPIQSMYVTEDISGNDLYTCLWSGGKDQFDSMIEDGADADDILNVVEELLFSEDGELPTMTDVNDLIWFEPDLIREHLGLSEEPIESGCHGKSKKKGKKKAVKSAKKSVKSAYNPWNGEGSIRVSLEVVEDGEHSSPDFSNTVMDLDDFVAECKSYAESCNGYYFVSENDSNSYKIEFRTGDDSFTDNPGTDPYYEESCGIVIAELIYPYTTDMADYIENA